VPYHAGRRPFQQERSHSFVRDSACGHADPPLLPLAVESPLGAQERFGMNCHGVRKGGVGDFQWTRVTKTDRGWRKNRDVRKVEGSRQAAGFCVQRELYV